jgi:hypothetical protein
LYYKIAFRSFIYLNSVGPNQGQYPCFVLHLITTCCTCTNQFYHCCSNINMAPKRKASSQVAALVKRVKGPGRRKASPTAPPPTAPPPTAPPPTATPPTASVTTRMDALEKQIETLTALLEKATDKLQAPTATDAVAQSQPCETPPSGEAGVVTVVEHITGKAPPPPVVHSAVPLSAGVSAKLKDSIWANEHIDMRDLLSPLDKQSYTMTMDNIESTPQVVWRPVAKKFKMTFAQWSTAWNKFMAIYTDHPDHCREAPQLAKHLDVVLKISRNNGDWATYDESFRTLLSEGSVAWGQVHQELYSDARLNTNVSGRGGYAPVSYNRRNYQGSYSQGSYSQGSYSQGSSGSQIPLGACIRHHKGQHCIAGITCRYQHNCFNCGGQHPYNICTAPVNRPFRVQPRFQPQGTNPKPSAFKSGNAPTPGPSGTNNNRNNRNNSSNPNNSA